MEGMLHVVAPETQNFRMVTCEDCSSFCLLIGGGLLICIAPRRGFLGWKDGKS